MLHEKWDLFYENIYPELLIFLDESAELIRPSAIENGAIWPETQYILSSINHTKEVNVFKEWFVKRVEFLNSHKNHGFFR